MTNRRAKIAATATVLGLGALGGVALGTNHGLPAAGQQLAAGGGARSVVTSASGAVLNQGTTARPGPSSRAPIVTRSSGAGARFDD